MQGVVCTRVGGSEMFHFTYGKFTCVCHVHLPFLNVPGNQSSGYRVELSSVLQSSEVLGKSIAIREKCIKVCLLANSPDLSHTPFSN